MKTFSKRQGGYNLVEVLVAMAILGSVMLSIVALFYLGRRNVYSGKQLTFANAVGVQVLEDLSSLNEQSLFAAFNITSTTALTSFTINGVRYDNSVLRTTDNISSSTEVNPPGFLTRWKTTIGTGNKLAKPSVSLVMTPTTATLYTAATPPLPAATILRVRVLVTWTEGQRPRTVVFDTTKTQR